MIFLLQVVTPDHPLPLLQTQLLTIQALAKLAIPREDPDAAVPLADEEVVLRAAQAHGEEARVPLPRHFHRPRDWKPPNRHVSTIMPNIHVQLRLNRHAQNTATSKSSCPKYSHI
jgi:hypothetical protein